MSMTLERLEELRGWLQMNLGEELVAICDLAEAALIAEPVDFVEPSPSKDTAGMMSREEAKKADRTLIDADAVGDERLFDETLLRLRATALAYHEAKEKLEEHDDIFEALDRCMRNNDRLKGEVATLRASLSEAMEVLERLRRSAALLQQNMEGCAVNHYQTDYEQQGLPGWLADTAKDIQQALAFIDKHKEGEG